MSTLPDEHDQDAEPPTADGEQPDVVDPDDDTPASDPDPAPGTDDA